LGASSAAAIRNGADAYVENAERYRAELRQLN
jgi:hypothetical protein